MTPFTLLPSHFFRACMGMGEILCSNPLATLVTKMGGFVLAPFKALGKLYSLTKSQEKPSVANNANASETANKENITHLVVPQKSFGFAMPVYSSSGTNFDSRINEIFEEKFKNKKAEAPAVLNNAIVPEEAEEGVVYNPNEDIAPTPSPEAKKPAVASVRVDNKEAKSISPKLRSNWEVSSTVLDNEATYKNIINVRREATKDRAKHLKEARLEKEKIAEILNKPLNAAESARLRLMGLKNISEKEQIIRQARLPENLQKWASLVAEAENALDLSEWCYEKGVDERQLSLWMQYDPQV